MKFAPVAVSDATLERTSGNPEVSTVNIPKKFQLADALLLESTKFQRNERTSAIGVAPKCAEIICTFIVHIE